MKKNIDKPKKIAVSVRIEPWLLAAVKETGSPLTEAIEEGLSMWLARRKDAPGGASAKARAPKAR